MADYSTTTHAPASLAPSVTNLVAHCAVCHTQWQVQSEVLTDAIACPFCHVTNELGAITIESEAPDFSGINQSNT
jgi:hypothetical protein